MTDAELAELGMWATAYVDELPPLPNKTGWLTGFPEQAATRLARHVPALVAEVQRLRAALAAVVAG